MITLLPIIALGFFLGLRQATDPDHVVAVTTIVSRQRSIRQALIGVLTDGNTTQARKSLRLCWTGFWKLDLVAEALESRG